MTEPIKDTDKGLTCGVCEEVLSSLASKEKKTLWVLEHLSCYLALLVDCARGGEDAAV